MRRRDHQGSYVFGRIGAGIGSTECAIRGSASADSVGNRACDQLRRHGHCVDDLGLAVKPGTRRFGTCRRYARRNSDGPISVSPSIRSRSVSWSA